MYNISSIHLAPVSSFTVHTVRIGHVRTGYRRSHGCTNKLPVPFPAEIRSSVVRVLMLAGADAKATDNRGKTPGARFQALSYLR